MLTHAASAKRANCPKCSRVIELPKSFVATVICPSCGSSLAVARRKNRSAAPPRPDASDEYELEPPVERTHLPVEINPPPREVRADPLPPPPQYPFLSGVFSFPWSRGALPPWLLMSIGLALVSLYAGIIIPGMLGSGGNAGALAAGFLVLSGVWVFFLTMTYTAACFLGVVEDTAAGLDNIEWPDANWREWFWTLWPPAYLFVLAALPGLLLGSIVPGYRLAMTLATAFILFPIAQLSALEAGMPFIPYSPPVVRTLKSHTSAWLKFYAISLAMCAVLTMACSGAYIFARGIEPMIEGPLLAAGVLIYGRLLGRLAWVAQVEPTDDARPRRRRARRDKTVRVEDLL